LGDRVYIGAHAIVLPGVQICADVIIGAGAVVSKSIDTPGTYLGVPATRYRQDIHKTAIIEDNTIIGGGGSIGALCHIVGGKKRATKIGNRVFIGHRVQVGHDAQIGNNCEIFTGALISGHCVLEEGVRIGVGAIIRPGKRIGHHAYVGAGAVVVKDIPPEIVVVGNPAKKLRNRYPNIMEKLWIKMKRLSK
jgi:acetyltransferase-like isoleucine patch superfamily enzyme